MSNVDLKSGDISVVEVDDKRHMVDLYTRVYMYTHSIDTSCLLIKNSLDRRAIKRLVIALYMLEIL